MRNKIIVPIPRVEFDVLKGRVDDITIPDPTFGFWKSMHDHAINTSAQNSMGVLTVTNNTNSPVVWRPRMAYSGALNHVTVTPGVGDGVLHTEMGGYIYFGVPSPNPLAWPGAARKCFWHWGTNFWHRSLTFVYWSDPQGFKRTTDWANHAGVQGFILQPGVNFINVTATHHFTSPTTIYQRGQDICATPPVRTARTIGGSDTGQPWERFSLQISVDIPRDVLCPTIVPRRS